MLWPVTPMGVDGATEVAGAVFGPGVLTAAAERGTVPRLVLQLNDAHSFCAVLGGQVVTGPALTNVNDFRIIPMQPRAPTFHRSNGVRPLFLLVGNSPSTWSAWSKFHKYAYAAEGRL